MKNKIGIYSYITISILAIAALSYVIFSRNNLLSQGIDTAETFLKIYYTVDDKDIDTFLKIAIEETQVQSMQILKNEYGFIMTQKAFDNVITKRIILENEKIMYENNCNLIYNGSNIKKSSKTYGKYPIFSYTVDVTVAFDNGNQKEIDLNGNITMVKENGNWLVNNFEPDRIGLLNSLDK